MLEGEQEQKMHVHDLVIVVLAGGGSCEALQQFKLNIRHLVHIQWPTNISWYYKALSLNE